MGKQQDKAAAGGSMALDAAVGVVGAVALTYAATNDLGFLPKLFGDAVEAKKYGSFEEFYPFYLSQHSNRQCQLCHVTGTALMAVWVVLLNADSLVKTLGIGSLSLAVGSAVSAMTMGHPTSICEVAAMAAVWAVFGTLLKFRFRVLFVSLLIGYGAAWFGHFYFEKNRPATWTFTTWSLMGDFRLFYTFASKMVVSLMNSHA